MLAFYVWALAQGYVSSNSLTYGNFPEQAPSGYAQVVRFRAETFYTPLLDGSNPMPTLTLSLWGRGVAASGKPLRTVIDVPVSLGVGWYSLSLPEDVTPWHGWVIGWALTRGQVDVLTFTLESRDCDTDRSGLVDSQDFFTFLTWFYGQDTRSDFNRDGVVSSDDFFLFLNCM